MTDDQLFQKKQECAGYKEKIEKIVSGGSLDLVFYSPVRNSCLYVSSSIDDIAGVEQIDDYLTNERVAARIWDGLKRCDDNRPFPTESDKIKCKQNIETIQNEIAAKIQELKGE